MELTLDRIAKTINGPNEAEHIGTAKLLELQDVRWGQLKSQEQVRLLRSAHFIMLLLVSRDAPAVPPDPVPSLPPPIPRGEGEPAPPVPAMPVCRASGDDILRIFRQFVCANATQWRMGAGIHHHPMWAMVAEEIQTEEQNQGPDWAFIQPENRTRHAVLVEQYAEQTAAWEAEDRGG